MLGHKELCTAPSPPSRSGRSRLGRALLAVTAMIPSAAMAADDARRPPSRLLPARGLVFYLEYDGLGAHAGAWQATAASAILRQKSAGDMITETARQALNRLLKVVPDNPITADDLVGLEEHVARHGMALSCYDEKGRTSTVVVLNAARGGEIPARCDRLLRFALRIKGGATPPAAARVRGRELRRLGLVDDAAAAAPARPDRSPVGVAEILNGAGGLDIPKTPVTWWLEGDSLMIVAGPGFDLGEILTKPEETRKDVIGRHHARVAALLATIEGIEADVTTHPAHALAAAEGREIDGFEADGLFFAASRAGGGVLVELRDRLRAAIGPGGAQGDEFNIAESLGLDRASPIVGRWGFRGKALVTDVRFLKPEPGPMTGVAGLLDRAGISRDRLPPIPRGMGIFACGSFRRDGDVRQALEPLLRLRKPESAAQLDAVEQAMREAIDPQLGVELRRHLGPTWCIYASPGGADGKSGPTVPTVLAGIDDADALDKLLARAAAAINAYLGKLEDGERDGPAAGGDRPALAVERLPAPARGYRLVSPAGVVPWLTDDLRPTILIGRSFIAFAANLSLAHRAIAAEDRPADCWAPTGDMATIFAGLPARVQFLRVGNPRDSSWPEAIASLPETAGPFLEAFVGADVPDDAEAAPPSGILGLLGVRKRQGLRARFDRSKLPGPDEIRAQIFPSILAAAVDDRGFRMISLEALPWGCVGLEAKFGGAPGMGRPLGLEIKYAPGR